MVIAHPFPLNSGAPIASGNFILYGNVVVVSAHCGSIVNTC